MSDSKEVNSDKKRLFEDFIRAYESVPCLWRVKSKHYRDKSKRVAAYNLLLEKYRLIDPNADKHAVVRKINILRTNYRRERKKIEESRRSSIGTNDVYQTSLWYYHLFAFLEDQETPRSSSNLKTEDGGLDQLTQNSGQHSDKSVEELDESSCSYSTDHDTLCVPSSEKVFPKRKTTVGHFKRSNEQSDSATESSERHRKKSIQEEDRYDIFGRQVAMKLRDIADKNYYQRLLAEKMINDTLFMAEMGQLTMPRLISDNFENTSATDFSPP